MRAKCNAVRCAAVMAEKNGRPRRGTQDGRVFAQDRQRLSVRSRSEMLSSRYVVLCSSICYVRAPSCGEKAVAGKEIANN